MNGFLPILDDQTYRIESEIGSGGGGVVYKAWHTRLQKYVILKRIKDGKLLNPDYQRIEVDILKNLKHSNLPQLYDFISDKSGVYTVMEFIPGRSFADLLKYGERFSQQDVIRWAAQLSSALTYLHSQNPPVLHSDIKPANIMLTPDGDICLIDFNVSLVLEGDSAAMIGISHGYASPEQYGPVGLPLSQQIVTGDNQPIAQVQASRDTTATDLEATYLVDQDEADLTNISNTGTSKYVETVLKATDYAKMEHCNRSVIESAHLQTIDRNDVSAQNMASSEKQRMKIRMDTRSDIYSLGATLYHLLTDEKPAIATGDIKPLSSFGLSLSEATIFIVEKCMERNPKDRFQASADLHEAVADIRKLDSRWKRLNVQKNIAVTLLTVMFILSGVSIMFGWQRMNIENVVHYNELVHSIVSISDKAIYLEAVELFPNKMDARYAWAMALFSAGLYEDAVAYIDGVMARVLAQTWDDQSIRRIGDIFFIQGNSYFELGDYRNAAASLVSAINNNPGNPEFYRDYAIALARIGYVDRAAELLEEIRVMQIGNDSISLLRGEIAYARQNYSTAVVYFREVVNATRDTYIRQRAFFFSNRAYQRVPERIDERIALMREAVTELSLSHQTLAIEQLADALVHAGQMGINSDANFREAISLFQDLQLRGNRTYTVYQNIGLLYQELGDFDTARAVYTEMITLFPDRYEAPMRLAFLALAEQALLPNEEREYEETAVWYERARELYSQRPQRAVDSMEMLMLISLMNELRQSGWLD